jgi:hypothetical protein
MFAAKIAPIEHQCAWVFPRILSCLLAARETLFAGLTAAGGALFGAWLAFVAVQDQIGMARRTEALAKEVENEKKLYEAEQPAARPLGMGRRSGLRQFPTPRSRASGLRAN